MTIEFSQRIGSTTIRMSLEIASTGEHEEWPVYQKASELWQSIVEYELGLLPEDQQAGASFKKLRKS